MPNTRTTTTQRIVHSPLVKVTGDAIVCIGSICYPSRWCVKRWRTRMRMAIRSHACSSPISSRATAQMSLSQSGIFIHCLLLCLLLFPVCVAVVTEMDVCEKARGTEVPLTTLADVVLRCLQAAVVAHFDVTHVCSPCEWVNCSKLLLEGNNHPQSLV